MAWHGTSWHGMLGQGTATSRTASPARFGELGVGWPGCVCGHLPLAVTGQPANIGSCVTEWMTADQGTVISGVTHDRCWRPCADRQRCDPVPMAEADLVTCDQTATRPSPSCHPWCRMWPAAAI